MRDFVSGAIMFVTAVGLLVSSMSIPNPGYDILGPAFLPKFVLWIILGLSLILMFDGWRKRAHDATLSDAPDRRGMLKAGGIIVLLALYILSINLSVAPFEVLSIIYLVASGLLLLPGRRDLRGMILIFAVSLMAAFAVGYLFKSILQVNLP